jgi:hypothetical protein
MIEAIIDEEEMEGIPMKAEIESHDELKFLTIMNIDGVTPEDI